MLMQNFESAADLDLTEPQRHALIKTLSFMECGKIKHISLDEVAYADADQEVVYAGLFNLSAWIDSDYRCGTVGCIGGTAELISGVSFDRWEYKPRLQQLFNPSTLIDPHSMKLSVDFDSVTVEQAARALRGFLTTGTADWSVFVP